MTGIDPRIVEAVHDTRLTWTAVGVLASILSQPGTEITAESLLPQSPHGETIEELRDALRILRETGWLPHE